MRRERQLEADVWKAEAAIGTAIVKPEMLSHAKQRLDLIQLEGKSEL